MSEGNPMTPMTHDDIGEARELAGRFCRYVPSYSGRDDVCAVFRLSEYQVAALIAHVRADSMECAAQGVELAAAGMGIVGETPASAIVARIAKAIRGAKP